jgi:hypothetical protein
MNILTLFPSQGKCFSNPWCDSLSHAILHTRVGPHTTNHAPSPSDHADCFQHCTPSGTTSYANAEPARCTACHATPPSTAAGSRCCAACQSPSPSAHTNAEPTHRTACHATPPSAAAGSRHCTACQSPSLSAHANAEPTYRATSPSTHADARSRHCAACHTSRFWAQCAKV